MCHKRFETTVNIVISLFVSGSKSFKSANQTVNDIATLWLNGSISGNITIQITSMNLPVGATPQFIANGANLNTARAQTIMQALTAAGVPIGQITILPSLRAATPSATITYQRNLASTTPVSNTETVPAGVQDSN